MLGRCREGAGPRAGWPGRPARPGLAGPVRRRPGADRLLLHAGQVLAGPPAPGAVPRPPAPAGAAAGRRRPGLPARPAADRAGDADPGDPGGRLRHRVQRHQPGADVALRLVLGRHRAPVAAVRAGHAGAQPAAADHTAPGAAPGQDRPRGRQGHARLARLLAGGGRSAGLHLAGAGLPQPRPPGERADLHPPVLPGAARGGGGVRGGLVRAGRPLRGLLHPDGPAVAVRAPPRGRPAGWCCAPPWPAWPRSR
jgi:hypothetical protein